jgi:hypothetical protein
LIRHAKPVQLSELTPRWKKAAIVVPVLGSLLAVTIAATINRPSSEKNDLVDQIGVLKLYDRSNDFLSTGAKNLFTSSLAGARREAWFVGTTFFISTDQYYDMLLGRLADGIDLNFLILDPTSQALSDTSRMLGVSKEELALQCNAGIRILLRLAGDAARANAPGKLNVKLVKDEITSRLYFFDPKTDNGLTYLVPQVTGANSQFLPGFLVKNSVAKFHAQYFDAAQSIWRDPDSVSLESWQALNPEFK